MELLIFHLAGKNFAVPAPAIIQLVRAVAIHPLFPAKKGIEGIINFQSQLLRVINLREWLGLPEKLLSASDYMLITQVEGNRFVLRVDRIEHIQFFEANSLDSSQCVKWGGELVQILELDKFLPMLHQAAGINDAA